MKKRENIAQGQGQEEPMQDADALARAIEVITAKQYRPGEALLACYSARIQQLMPDADYLGRRGVDLVALAKALEKGLDVKLFGEVIQYKAWCIDEFNRFIRADISCQVINTGMRLFLDHPRNW
jgi:hypothetical protein